MIELYYTWVTMQRTVLHKRAGRRADVVEHLLGQTADWSLNGEELVHDAFGWFVV